MKKKKKHHHLTGSLTLTLLSVIGAGTAVWGAEAVGAGSAPDPAAGMAEAQMNNMVMIAAFLGFTAMILLIILVMFSVANAQKSIKKIKTAKDSTLKKAVGVTAALLLLTLPVWAEEAAKKVVPAFDPGKWAFDLISYITIGLGVLNLGLVAGIIYSFDYYLQLTHGTSLAKILPDFGLGTLFSWEKLTGQKAVTSRSNLDTALDHSYDGIVELDNPAPPLFNYILYGTIIFAGVYWTVYHVAESAPLMHEEYNIQMAEAAQLKAERMKLASNMVDENNVKASADPGQLADGKSLFKANCAACHGDNGEGKVGPNFADEFWIHGGGAKNVFKTIKYGVPEKGMIAWEKQLAPGQIANLTNYILSLKGTNPANPKEPQGEKWVEGETSKPDSSKASASGQKDASDGTTKLN